MAASDPLAPAGAVPLGAAQPGAVKPGAVPLNAVQPCDPQELAQVLEGIRRVEIHCPGHQGDQVAPVMLQREIAELVQALNVVEVTDRACMCLGDIGLRFFDASRKVVAEVGVHLPDEVKWQQWPGDARLRDPARLRAWLWRNGAGVLTGALQPSGPPAP